MIKNRLFTRVFLALALGSVLASIPNNALAMERHPFKRERESQFAMWAIMMGFAVTTDPAVVMAEWQRRQGQIAAFFAGEAAPRPEARAQVEILPLPAGIPLQEEGTPVRRVRARMERGDDGAVHRIVDQEEVPLQIDVTPWTADINDNAVYLITRNGVVMGRHVLGRRTLDDEVVVGLVVDIVRNLLEAGVLNDDFYVGRAGDPLDRSRAHLADVQDKDGLRKAARLRKMMQDGHIPVMQALFRGAADEQIDLLEGLLIMATRASTSKHGLCSVRPSEKVRDFYKRHLESRINELFREYESSEDLTLKAFCGLKTDLSRRFSEDPDKDDGSSTDGQSGESSSSGTVSVK